MLVFLTTFFHFANHTKLVLNITAKLILSYLFYHVGPIPTPSRGTSAAVIVKEKDDVVNDKWDARFSNFTGPTVTIQVSIVKMFYRHQYLTIITLNKKYHGSKKNLIKV